MRNPHWSEGPLALYCGDVVEVLREMPDRSVHTVITSPPYWGLRDYGTANWQGGVDPTCPECGGAGETPESAARDEACGRCSGMGAIACDHKGAVKQSVRSTLAGNGHGNGKPLSPSLQAQSEPVGQTCPKCGARRVDGQLGLEPTPEAYVERMVAVFREVKRVLRDDGTLWLNIGDSYASTGYRAHQPTDNGQPKPAAWSDDRRGFSVQRTAVGRIKPKDRIMMPARLAIALQEDGWWLRDEIVWSKPNAMPSSVTDRTTSAHEMLYLLSKKARYFFDGEAVRERASDVSLARISQATFADQTGGPKDYANGTNPNRSARKALENFAANPGRNLRSVWTIPTQPYPGLHFATFPVKLVEPCVKAGTSERGVCPECGAPWRRVVVKGVPVPRPDNPNPVIPYDAKSGLNHGTGATSLHMERERSTTGWAPGCAHDASPVPATVLDPFAGSGTTLLVAQSLGRRGVGIDLNPEYLRQAEVRLAKGLAKTRAELARGVQHVLWQQEARR